MRLLPTFAILLFLLSASFALQNETYGLNLIPSVPPSLNFSHLPDLLPTTPQAEPSPTQSSISIFQEPLTMKNVSFAGGILQITNTSQCGFIEGVRHCYFLVQLPDGVDLTSAATMEGIAANFTHQIEGISTSRIISADAEDTTPLNETTGGGIGIGGRGRLIRLPTHLNAGMQGARIGTGTTPRRIILTATDDSLQNNGMGFLLDFTMQNDTTGSFNITLQTSAGSVEIDLYVSNCFGTGGSGVYELQADLWTNGGVCINVNDNDVTIRCHGHSIAGAGGGATPIGIEIAGNMANTVIEECRIYGFDSDIRADNNNIGVIINNSILEGEFKGKNLFDAGGGGSSGIITNNILHGDWNDVNGIYIANAYNPDGFLIQNNEIRTQHKAEGINIDGDGFYITIQNNSVTDDFASTTEIDNSVSGGLVQILNNSFRMEGTATSNPIVLISNTYNAVLYGNTFTETDSGTGRYALNLDSSSTYNIAALNNFSTEGWIEDDDTTGSNMYNAYDALGTQQGNYYMGLAALGLTYCDSDDDYYNDACQPTDYSATINEATVGATHWLDSGMSFTGDYAPNDGLLHSGCRVLTGDFNMTQDLYTFSPLYGKQACFTTTYDNDITLDCKGHTIYQGAYAYGSNLMLDFEDYTNNVKVANCNVVGQEGVRAFYDASPHEAHFENFTYLGNMSDHFQVMQGYFIHSTFKNIHIDGCSRFLSSFDGYPYDDTFDGINISNCGGGIWSIEIFGSGGLKNSMFRNIYMDTNYSAYYWDFGTGIYFTSSGDATNNTFINVTNNYGKNDTVQYWGTDAAQNIQSRRNTGWFPKLTANGSDATVRGETAHYGGESCGFNENGIANCTLRYWYNNTDFSFVWIFGNITYPIGYANTGVPYPIERQCSILIKYRFNDTASPSDNRSVSCGMYDFYNGTLLSMKTSNYTNGTEGSFTFTGITTSGNYAFNCTGTVLGASNNTQTEAVQLLGTGFCVGGADYFAQFPKTSNPIIYIIVIVGLIIAGTFYWVSKHGRKKDSV